MRPATVLCLWLVAGVHHVASVIDGPSSYERYVELERSIHRWVDAKGAQVLPVLVAAGRQGNVSSECLRNVSALIGGIRQLESWALRFVDANPRIPEGFLKGSLYLLGDFDECLSTVVPNTDGTVSFGGQHCIVHYDLILPRTEGSATTVDGLEKAFRNRSGLAHAVSELSLLFQGFKPKLGLCVPTGCSPEDIQSLLHHFAPKIMLNATVRYCQAEDLTISFDGKRILILCGFGLLIAVNAVATILDCCLKDKNLKTRGMLTKVVLCFSVARNSQKILDTSTSNQSLACLHGVRVLTVFYIILSHVAFNILEIPSTRNLLDWVTKSPEFLFQFMLNSTLCVDVFMFLGGFLNSYQRTGRDPNGQLTDRSPGFFKVILLRIWRLYPLYAAVILWSFLMVPQGPLAPEMSRKYWRNCEENWWWNALFIHNLFNFDKLCWAHTWYTSTDMQVFILSLLPVSLLIKNKKAGLSVITVLVVFTLAFTSTLSWVIEATPIVLPSTATEESYIKFTMLHTMPTTHASTYFLGVLVGFYVAKGQAIRISKKCLTIGWMGAFLSSISVHIITWLWNNGIPFPPLFGAIFFSFSKLLYVLGIAWMLFCCTTGHGGIINDFLSWKVWIPLSRLSYAVYLTSVIIQVFFRLSSKYMDHMDTIHVAWQLMGDIFISFLVAFVFVVLVESPALALQKLLLIQPRKDDSDKKKE